MTEFCILEKPILVWNAFLNKKDNERDNEMVQLTKIILKQTARHTR